MIRIARAALALIVFAAIGPGLPLALVFTVGNPLHAWSDIAAGDLSDSAVIAIMAAVAYLAWASFAIAFVLELMQRFVAAVRRRPSTRLRIPLLGLQLDLAHWVIAALFLVGPATAMFVAPAGVHAATIPAATSTMSPGSQGPASMSSTGIVAPVQSAPIQSAAIPNVTYVIPDQGGMRSYWAMAEHYLGDGQRWNEIWQLNQGQTQTDGSVMDSPRQLHSGWSVLIPSQSGAAAVPSVATHQVVVAPGDTLSGLAAADGVTDWHAIWPGTAAHAEPGGARLSDPDLIKPGWTVTLPGATPLGVGAVPTTTGPSSPAVTSIVAPATVNPPPAPAVSLDPPPASPAPVSSPSTTASGASTQLPRPMGEWAELLAPGAGVLAGCIFLALRRSRRRQLRHRRAGAAIAASPPRLRGLDLAVAAVGAPAVAAVEFVDRSLRSLAAATRDSGRALPAAAAARLSDDAFELVLAEPTDEIPAAPWRAESPQLWTIQRSPAIYAELAGVRTVAAAPFPALVSVGCTSAGEEWFVDLEQAGLIEIDAEPQRALDLARYLVAQLAHSTWSDHLAVTVAGFGAELVALNPMRVIHRDDVAAAVSETTADLAAVRAVGEAAGLDVLGGRASGLAADAWMPHVLFLPPGWAEVDGAAAPVHALLDVLGDHPARSATAVVACGGIDHAPDGPSLRLCIDDEGTLTIPQLGVTTTAHLLPAGPAAELGDYLAFARAVDHEVAMPAAAADSGWGVFADLAGALRTELTEPRSNSAVFGRSVLPKSDADYLELTATTEQDLHVLAPRVTAATSAALADADPDLDRDLAVWRDATSPTPMLRLLGRIGLTASGTRPERSEGVVIEAVTYLALHTGGVPAGQFAADMWPGEDDFERSLSLARVLSFARSWLGNDPSTGAAYLPYVGPSDRGSASAEYRLDGVLVDVDLFRRLRTRGEANGSAGQADLVAALALVTGIPMDGLRLGGGGWMNAEGVLNADIVTSAITEVAHVVATRALADGDIAQARWAAEVALKAGAADDRPLLDLAAVHAAIGDYEALQGTLRRLHDHHDGAVDEDLPSRTGDVLRRKGWFDLADAS